MIVLFTDFGTQDAYIGQMKAVLARVAPGIDVIDLLHHVPRHNIQAGAYLLPAYVEEFPDDTVFICVIDPGVGGERKPLMIKAFNKWFVGPDNGLFQVLANRDPSHKVFPIDWRPKKLSSSFHGRDLFAPVGAMLARGEIPTSSPGELSRQAGMSWPDDLFEAIYLDHFGNAISGIRAEQVPTNAHLEVNGHKLSYSRTFASVTTGEAFWYENSNGLIEFAVNQGSAQVELDIDIGDLITISV